MTQKYAWFNRVNPMFYNKVIAICHEFGWPSSFASYLMTCIAFETGYQFKSTIKNKYTNAIGLIQFMPATARALGTTTMALSKMTELDQLKYVAKYFSPYKRQIKCLEDMYMAILYPKYITAELEHPVFTRPSVAYTQNAGLDFDKDGVITKNDICEIIRKCYAKGMSDRNAKVI